jgi:putative ABC transport system substrate-binding protein
VSVLTPELEPKRLELLHLLVPQARRIGYLVNLSNPLASGIMADLQTAARKLGLQIETFDAPTVRTLTQLEQFEPRVQGIRESGLNGIIDLHSA